MADWKKFASNNWLDLTLSGVGVVSDIASGKVRIVPSHS